ncbi:hypothetical protein [Nocardia sp. R7R-8]|uniref:hypothetical protein n=1 Tax=Nocardia sp. R7R-8 TaxID=3459304 RepID=UPI00403E16F3
MNEKLENYLLYYVDDDWAPISEFDTTVRKIDPENYSREFVLKVIREVAAKGYIEFGAFPGGGRSWEPWNVSIDEAMSRIAHGYNEETGYLDITYDGIGTNEVFRANITDAGRLRLHKLGDPYKKYGDPWAGDPFIHAR